MNFVYPNFLWAFFLVLIPIIIHLFNFRRYKSVYFSRVKFLKEIVEDSRAGSKLKHLLILLSRLLALTALILAFAQPYIPLAGEEATENITSLYIDNSFSMQAEGLDGTLLNEVKNQAIDLVKSFEPNERICLLTDDLLSTQQRFYAKGEIIEKIKELDFSAKTTGLSAVMKLQLDLLTGVEEKGNKRLFLFSDFQKSSSSWEGIVKEDMATYIYAAKPVLPENIYIDSIWFESPIHRTNTPVELSYRIKNNGNVNQEDLVVKLMVNGSLVSTTRVSIPANSYTEGFIVITDRTVGAKSAKLSIATSQLFFDDEFYFTYDTKERVEILIIQPKNDQITNISQLYSLDPYYHTEIATIENVTTEMFKNKELIIIQNIDNLPSGFKELMDNSLSAGATLLLIPGTNIDKSSWNSYFTKHNLPTFGSLDTTKISLTYFNAEDPLYNGVFESTPSKYKHPQAYGSYDLQLLGNQRYITLFGRSPTSPFLYYTMEENSRIVVMASPLNIKYTNFQNHALFAATLLRFAEAATFQKPLFMTIGKMANFPIHQEIAEKKPIHLVNIEEQVDVIPQLTTVGNSRSVSFNNLEDYIRRAGFYTLTDDNGFEQLLGLNYDRKESLISSYTAEEVIEEFNKVGWMNVKNVDLNAKGNIEINALRVTEYWRILLILALIFLGIEILLLKFWKS